MSSITGKQDESQFLLCCGSQIRKFKVDRECFIIGLKLYLLNHYRTPPFLLIPSGNVIDMFLAHCNLSNQHETLISVRNLQILIDGRNYKIHNLLDLQNECKL
jgi:hypothetical protein